MAGATVLCGPMGFGANSRLHTSKILELSTDLTIIIEIVDSPEETRTNPSAPLLSTKWSRKGLSPSKTYACCGIGTTIKIKRAKMNEDHLAVRLDHLHVGDEVLEVLNLDGGRLTVEQRQFRQLHDDPRLRRSPWAASMNM